VVVPPEFDFLHDAIPGMVIIAPSAKTITSFDKVFFIVSFIYYIPFRFDSNQGHYVPPKTHYSNYNDANSLVANFFLGLCSSLMESCVLTGDFGKKGGIPII